MPIKFLVLEGGILGLGGGGKCRFWFYGDFADKLLLPDSICGSVRIRKGGGAKRIVRLGGGGKTYCKVPPPNPVLEASESGICQVCPRFF